MNHGDSWPVGNMSTRTIPVHACAADAEHRVHHQHDGGGAVAGPADVSCSQALSLHLLAATGGDALLALPSSCLALSAHHWMQNCCC